MNILALKERTKNLLSLGESHFREFKSAYQGPLDNKKPGSIKDLNRYITEALVAFSNADGGSIIIGVEDDGTVTGLPFTESEIQSMLSAYKDYIHTDSILPIEIETIIRDLNECTVLLFSVSKGTDEIYQLSDGRCVVRKDKQTVPVSFKRIQFERQEILSRSFDRAFVDGATVSDLDQTLIQSISSSYLVGLSVEYYLQQTGLAEFGLNDLRLKNAAILLFAKDISKWAPRCQVRIVQVEGDNLKTGKDYNVVNDEIITGNIFSLITNSWNKLRPFLAYKTEFGMEAKFEQKYIYPEEAIREALINAITHRDYSIQNGIDIFIFNNRLEVSSPGRLLSTISIDDLRALKGAHESRNSLISKILRENSFVRELGEGMRRIFSLLESQEMESPILNNAENYFSITFKNKSIYSAKEESYLNIFNKFELTANQKRIVILGIKKDEISPQDIYKAMNTNDRDTYDREVTGLRRHGILVQTRTNPSATILAKKLKITKQAIGRFKIEMPK